LLLTFDRDGSGTLDAHELKGALRQLGLECSDLSVAKIVRAWDADASGKLDLLEFTDLVRSLRAFNKYDKDASGDIDIDELRPALRRLGFPADTATANAILKWYDHDESGRIELYEFAIMARDMSVFTAYDEDHTGTLDATKLRPALAKLGLAASEAEVRRIIHVWDDNESGVINLLEFAEIIRDLQVFEQFDLDRSGSISVVELRNALAKLGVQLSHPATRGLLLKYDSDGSGLIEFPEFRALAEDLPSLVGREKGSFFQMHHAERAYVHAEDVRDNAIHADLDTTFKKASMNKSDPEAAAYVAVGGRPASVLAALRSTPRATPRAASVLDAAQTGDSNPFDSRLSFSSFGRNRAPADSSRNVRSAHLLAGPHTKLHESKTMIRGSIG